MRLIFAVMLVALSAPLALAQFGTISLTPGHIYTVADGTRTIYERDSNGAYLNYLEAHLQDAEELRGLAIGPDGLLYVSAVKNYNLTVLVYNGDSFALEAYPMPSIYMMGNANYGKIALDQQNIYVAAGSYLTRFRRGDHNSGQTIYTNNQVLDVDILPSGNLLVAWAYGIDEITTSGALVRHLGPQFPQSYSDIRGIEYDPLSNKIFATQLGYTPGFFNQLMRLNFETGALEASTFFNSPNDLFLTDSGLSLVGSAVEIPRLSRTFQQLPSSFRESRHMFVTQYSIPEPGSLLFIFIPLAAIIGRNRKGGTGKIVKRS